MTQMRLVDVDLDALRHLLHDVEHEQIAANEVLAAKGAERNEKLTSLFKKLVQADRECHETASDLAQDICSLIGSSSPETESDGQSKGYIGQLLCYAVESLEASAQLLEDVKERWRNEIVLIFQANQNALSLVQETQAQFKAEESANENSTADTIAHFWVRWFELLARLQHFFLEEMPTAQADIIRSTASGESEAIESYKETVSLLGWPVIAVSYDAQGTAPNGSEAWESFTSQLQAALGDFSPFPEIEELPEGFAERLQLACNCLQPDPANQSQSGDDDNISLENDSWLDVAMLTQRDNRDKAVVKLAKEQLTAIFGLPSELLIDSNDDPISQDPGEESPNEEQETDAASQITADDGLRLAESRSNDSFASSDDELNSPMPSRRSGEESGEEEDPSDAKQKKARKRQQLIHEVIATEETYLSHLITVRDCFETPLAALARSPFPLVSQNDVTELFGALPQLIGLSKELLSSCKADPTAKGLALAFDSLAPFMKLHSFFAQKYNANKSFFKEQCRQERFLAWVKAQQAQAGNTFEAFYITPIQRVPRYVMLLNNILDCTEECDPDYPVIERAKTKVSESANHINEIIGHSEGGMKLAIFNARIRHFPPNVEVLAPGRHFVRQDMCHVVFPGYGKATRQSLVLCSDILFVTTRHINLSPDGGYKYTYRAHYHTQEAQATVLRDHYEWFQEKHPQLDWLTATLDGDTLSIGLSKQSNCEQFALTLNQLAAKQETRRKSFAVAGGHNTMRRSRSYGMTGTRGQRDAQTETDSQPQTEASRRAQTPALSLQVSKRDGPERSALTSTSPVAAPRPTPRPRPRPANSEPDSDHSGVQPPVKPTPRIKETSPSNDCLALPLVHSFEKENLAEGGLMEENWGGLVRSKSFSIEPMDLAEHRQAMASLAAEAVKRSLSRHTTQKDDEEEER